MALKCTKAVLHGMEQRHSYAGRLFGFSHASDDFSLADDLLLDCNYVPFGLREVLAPERPPGWRLRIAMFHGSPLPPPILLRIPLHRRRRQWRKFLSRVELSLSRDIVTNRELHDEPYPGRTTNTLCAGYLLLAVSRRAMNPLGAVAMRPVSSSALSARR
jgi:hypothetical protein